MIRFTLFGVPVEIQPWFWVTSALLGGAFRADSREDILMVALFMAVSAVSILVHEFGHALVGRRLGGGAANIVLWGMGGLAYNQGGRFTKSGRFWMIAAGPGFGFALGLLTLAGLLIGFGWHDGLNVASRMLFGIWLDESVPGWPPLRESVFDLLNTPRLKIVYCLLWVNFWWGVINLLPVLPLDGGQITDLFVTPQKRVYVVGMVAAGAMAVFAMVSMRSPYTALMFGFLCWQNYQNYSSTGWR